MPGKRFSSNYAAVVIDGSATIRHRIALDGQIQLFIDGGKPEQIDIYFPTKKSLETLILEGTRALLDKEIEN